MEKLGDLSFMAFEIGHEASFTETVLIIYIQRICLGFLANRKPQKSWTNNNQI